MSIDALNALGILSALLLALSLLVGLLALAVSFAERSRVTVRKWLALAWFATLLVPAVAAGIAIVVVRILLGLPPSSPFFVTNNVGIAIVVATVLTAFILTMVVIAWLTGRMVLRPLAAMSDAARQIAAGDLDISLPSPALAEVAEVAQAFGSMSTALRGSIERQAEVEQQRRLFISAVAHDLRTPLFSLRGYLEGLQTGIAATVEKRARYLSICREQAETLERRVADLFTYSRLEYLDEQPVFAPVDLSALLRSLAESVRPRAVERDITVALEIPARACAVSGDEHLLRRAIENLLDNALHYTPAGGRVRVACDRAGDHCAFSIADSGPGIALRDLPHIFSPLYRGESSRNRQTGGAGLGLTVARTILRRHGGDLRAANREEGGAIFTGILPAVEDALADSRSLAG